MVRNAHPMMVTILDNDGEVIGQSPIIPDMDVTAIQSGSRVSVFLRHGHREGSLCKFLGMLVLSLALSLVLALALALALAPSPGPR